SRGDVQSPQVHEPDGHRSARRRLRPLQWRPGAADVSGRAEELRERRVRLLHGRGAGKPGLPGGGGYTVRGIANQKPTFPVGRPSAVTIMQELDYSWNGVDTNFTWRGPHGIRMNGGTSTGRARRDQCGTERGAPNIKAADGNSPA